MCVIVSLWTGLTFVQIIGLVACSAPSHYLNQCWIVVNFSFVKMHLKMSSEKRRPFCPQGDELNFTYIWSKESYWQIVSIASGNGLASQQRARYTTKIHVRGFFDTDLHEVSWHFAYRGISHIRRTKSQYSNDSHLALKSSLANPLKPGVKSRMKM